MSFPRLRRIAAILGRGLVYSLAAGVVLGVAALAAVETGWGKNEIRQLIVRQAGNYLTASLEIDRLSGSLFSGIELEGVRLSRDGRALIAIDRVALEYSLRELFDQGTSIRSLRVVRPRVSGGRQADGRWDLGALLNRDQTRPQGDRPRRPLRLRSIEVTDATIELRDPVAFGAAHVPARFASLAGRLSFDDDGFTRRVVFSELSWVGTKPDLTITGLTGSFETGREGVAFQALAVRTPRSAFTLDGRVARGDSPAVLNLQVHAEKFAFQEWSGILTGLKNIAIEAVFDARLTGPLANLAVDLNLQSNGGNVRGPFVLDTSVPGWHGKGTVDLQRLDLGRWLNRADRPSDISGRVGFDMALNLGHAPTGSYTFTGTHAGYFGYEGDDIRATGTIVSSEARISEGAATAYGASVKLESSTISFAAPYAFRFRGSVDGIDLRRLPRPVPVPHVESLLTFLYDVTGQFSSPFIRGRATFAPSEFLGATIEGGSTGTIDTSPPALRYSGEGDISDVDLHRFGEGLNVGWMQQERYAGTLSGHFLVNGTGTSSATMTIDGGGRLERGAFFGGRLSDAGVHVHIAGGSLEAGYDGRLDRVDPALALDDPRFAASLTGTGRASFFVRNLLTQSPSLGDYSIDAAMTIERSTVRGVEIEAGEFSGALAGGTLSVAALNVSGPAVAGSGAGSIAFSDPSQTTFNYDVTRASLPAFERILGRRIDGTIATKGVMRGLPGALRFTGEASAERLEAADIRAELSTASYDATVPDDDPARATVRVEGRVSSLEVSGQPLESVTGVAALESRRLGFDLQVQRDLDLSGRAAGEVLIHQDARSLDVSALTLAIEDSAWRLTDTPVDPTVAWDEAGVAVGLMTFEHAADANQRVSVSGTWKADGTGALRASLSHVFLDTMTREQPPRYGGVVDAEAVLSGTRERPTVAATLAVTDGRVRQLSYQKLAGRVDYANDALSVDVRLDQAPGVWLTAAGTVPMSVFDATRPEQPMDLAVSSSSIGLGLIEGLTDVVRDVTGTMGLDVSVIGTSRDPHFAGTVTVEDAAFVVASSGARYRNGRVALRLGSDRVTVEALHVEDSRGRPLEVRGSLGTHELRVGDLEIDATAKGFEVLRNEFGTVEIDAQLRLRGMAESPRVQGSLTVSSGELRVDEILDRVLFRPYSTEAALPANVDVVAALNPWARLGLNIELHVPGTLRMVGDEVQVRSGTPLGLGSFNLRAIGDLYLYKDPGDVMYLTGSLDSVSGTYAFQGRRFDIDPASSINFHGDLDPEVYVTVERIISGVATRVAISGLLSEPELLLSSTPPLEPSDVLSLIVFGTSTNQLSTTQQGELAIRAGALAAGFLATPLIGALERTLGLDVLEIEAPTDSRSGPRVTIGDEIAPGLVARFSRQFGPDEYDEATLEYYLSQILRIRATFSDAGALNARAPFRRTERAGIDLILFFSF
jgi:hypothetical protein